MCPVLQATDNQNRRLGIWHINAGQLKATRPDLTEAELFSAGQAFFSALAIEQRDAKTWKRAES